MKITSIMKKKQKHTLQICLFNGMIEWNGRMIHSITVNPLIFRVIIKNESILEWNKL
jgi:hypothetical protein